MNRRRIVRAAAAALVALTAVPATAADRSWFGGNGDWSLAGNWAPAGVPGAGDRAVLNAGTATLAVDAALGQLTLGGGSLAGAGTLTVGGASTWTAGTVSGTGGVVFDGDLAISGATHKTLFGGRSVELRGTTTWGGNTAAGNNLIRFWHGGTLTNVGTFVDANAFDSRVYWFAGAGNTFANAGVYNKTAASLTVIDPGVAFDNTGTVNVDGGTFMTSGGTSSGTFNVAAGAKVELRNGTHTWNGVTTAGAGVLHIGTDNVGADASVAINGGTYTAALLFSGSTIGGSDHAFHTASTWSGGTFSGAARTTFLGNVALSGDATKTLHGGRIVDLHATTTWSGNTAAGGNAIRFWNGGTLNNLGTFVDANASDTVITISGSGAHTFNNVGTYDKRTDTVTAVDSRVAFNNSGTVVARAGTLLPAGGTSTGTFDIAAGATLEFRNGDSTLAGATTGGAGRLVISSDDVGADATVTIDGGTHTARLLLSGSVLTGADHAFQASADWTGGSIVGAARTDFLGDVSIAGNATKTLWLGRTVALHGTTTWSGNAAAGGNTIRFWNGGTLHNVGTFDDANAFDATMRQFTGGPHAFDNAGTYNKSTDTVTTVELGVAFNNTGKVDVQAGTLQVRSATTNGGMVRVAAGAVYAGAVHPDSRLAFVNEGVLTGGGTVATRAGGAIANAGRVLPGDGIGTLTIDGDLTQRAGGVVEIELGSPSSFDRLAVTDDVVLAGTLLVVDAGYAPVVGDRFVVLTFDERVGGTFELDWVGFGAGVEFAALYHANDVTIIVTEVPEPATAALLAVGVAAVVGRSRRRRGARRRR